jgi:hypothetical protein
LGARKKWLREYKQWSELRAARVRARATDVGVRETPQDVLEVGDKPNTEEGGRLFPGAITAIDEASGRRCFAYAYAYDIWRWLCR